MFSRHLGDPQRRAIEPLKPPGPPFVDDRKSAITWQNAHGTGSMFTPSNLCLKGLLLVEEAFRIVTHGGNR